MFRCTATAISTNMRVAFPVARKLAFSPPFPLAAWSATYPSAASRTTQASDTFFFLAISSRVSYSSGGKLIVVRICTVLWAFIIAACPFNKRFAALHHIGEDKTSPPLHPIHEAMTCAVGAVPLDAQSPARRTYEDGLGAVVIDFQIGATSYTSESIPLLQASTSRTSAGDIAFANRPSLWPESAWSGATARNFARDAIRGVERDAGEWCAERVCDGFWLFLSS
jgi:hypothetical protein